MDNLTTPDSFDGFESVSKLNEDYVFNRLFPWFDTTHVLIENSSDKLVYLMIYEDLDIEDIEGKSNKEIISIFKDKDHTGFMYDLGSIRLGFKSNNVTLFLFVKTNEMKYISVDVRKSGIVMI